VVGGAALVQPSGSLIGPGGLVVPRKVVPPQGFKVCGMTPKAAMAHKF